VKGDFETNVPGIYIAGELGGMGLIRNAVEQGRQAAANIARHLQERGEHGVELDLVIVGAGPAGISAALQARREGLRFRVLDREESFGGTILSYTRRKLVMTRPLELPGQETLRIREVSKEQLTELFETATAEAGLELTGNAQVQRVEKVNGHFRLSTTTGDYEAAAVLLAIGRRGTPRRLGVPGETSGKVAYRLLEPEDFAGRKLLVVGGGDSAVEAALSRAEVDGTTVHLSYRREKIFRIKEGNLHRLEEAVETGAIQLLLPSEVLRIEPEEAGKCSGLTAALGWILHDLKLRLRLASPRRAFRRETDLERAEVRELLGLLRQRRRMAALGVAHRLLHHWHIVHRPFALVMFVILAVHIGVAWFFGYRWIF
jgi:thioredoxin reductase